MKQRDLAKVVLLFTASLFLTPLIYLACETLLELPRVGLILAGLLHAVASGYVLNKTIRRSSDVGQWMFDLGSRTEMKLSIVAVITGLFALGAVIHRIHHIIWSP